MYWIAGKDFDYVDDAPTYIQYQIYTTQVDRLLEDRLKNKWYWDNVGRNFEDYELKRDFGEYRVMRRCIPTEYSITAIQTGYYEDGEWIWQEFFRPVHEFGDN